MHEHPEEKCTHELEYCARCDVVYCERCGREWINKRKQVIVNPKRDTDDIWKRPHTPNPWNPYVSPTWNNTSFHKHIDVEAE